MARILTDRNPNHPHYQLANHLQNLRVAYRKNSNVALEQFRTIAGLPTQPTRAKLLDALVEFGEAKWKAAWLKRVGWPYEDIHDPEKFAQHQASNHAKQLGSTTEALVTDAMIDDAVQAMALGGRAEASRVEQLYSVRAILKSGYAGVSKDGVVADRRRKGVWGILPKNDILGTPEPLEVTEEVRRMFYADLEAKANLEAAALEPVDMRSIRDEAGKQFTREEFDALPKEEQHEIRNYRGHVLQLLCRSGYAGTDPEGRIVDRRIEPESMPLPKGVMFGSPEPLPLPCPV